MQKIIHGSDLKLSDSLQNLGSSGNVFVDTNSKTIHIKEGLNLTLDGVTIQAFYSFLKTSWKTDNQLIRFSFPMEGITPEQFEFTWPWKLSSDSIELIRDGGFAVKDQNGQSLQEYACCITLGEIGETDQVYYTNDSVTAIDFILTGPVNQCIKILDTENTFDQRDTLILYVREQGKQYNSANLDQIGVSLLEPKAYRFSLENAPDLKITHTDDQIKTGTVYQGMQIRPEQLVTRTIDEVQYNFNKIIDVGGSFPQAEEIYEWVQWNLRQSENKLKEELLEFVGDILRTKKGVFIDGFALSDINRLEFRDLDNQIRKYPFISTLTLNFNDTLVQDSGSKFAVFFTESRDGEFNNQNAIIVKDTNGNDMVGEINVPKLQFSFDFDNNIQGGRVPGTPANITVVAMGLEKAQYIEVQGEIRRSNNNSVLLSAGIERNYTI